MEPRHPIPPFTPDSAKAKVLAAENAWNTKNPELISHAYTPDTVWRNRSVNLEGREQVVEFLTKKWEVEHEYALRKSLWAFTDNHIAVRFQYEWHDDSGQWFRSYGNENWDFDASGYMKTREASINDVPIQESQRRIFGKRSDGDRSEVPLF